MRRPPPSPTKDKPEDNRRKRRGLDELAQLRGQLRSGENRKREQGADRSSIRRQTGKSPQAKDDSDDLRAFRDSVRGTAPLKDRGRAEIETPKPDPILRAKEEPPPEEVSLASASLSFDALSDEEYFRVMMEEVMPQKDSGRVDSASSRSRGIPGDDEIPSPMLAGFLPPDSDALSAEELFRRATRGVEPIDSRNRAEVETQRPKPEPLKRHEDERSALQESLATPLTLEDRLDAGDETVFLRPGLPRRTLVDLRRGRWTLQAEIDLHGFNRDEARAMLSGFLVGCLQRGYRFIRVIHGKGLGSPGRESILKHLSRAWLAQREEILAFCQAGPNQGGSGALLVLLRSPNTRPRPADAEPQR